MLRKTKKLAVEGGTKAWTKGFPAWPQFDRKADAKVLDILHSGRVNYWTGHVGMEFEKAWATWLGVRNAMAVSNGTAALHVALTALGVGSGDEVVCTSPESFPAVVRVGARPVLADAAKIEAAVTSRTKAVIVLHLGGMVAEMGPILKFAKKRGVYVVEDCAQCIGGVYKGRKAGAIGCVSCFSFGPTAPLSTGGEGGMVCCNDDKLAWEVRSVRDHGYDVRAKLDLLRAEGRQVYVHRRVGYNFRMTEIQSAIGLVELRRFDTWNLPRRRKLGKALVRGLAGHPLVACAPVDTKARQNGFGLAAFALDASKLRCTASEFVAAVRAEGACAFLQGDAMIAFWTHPTYTLAHVGADVRAFKKVATATMTRGGCHEQA